MSEIDPELIGFIFGLIIAVIGVLAMLVGALGAWTLTVETFSSNVALILVGAFVAGLGTIIALACSDKLDDVRGALSDLLHFISDVFKR
jgi:uncharacterized membrane protein YgaE (UPF0421/DUF939 family)